MKDWFKRLWNCIIEFVVGGLMFMIVPFTISVFQPDFFAYAGFFTWLFIIFQTFLTIGFYLFLFSDSIISFIKGIKNKRYVYMSYQVIVFAWTIFLVVRFAVLVV